MKDAAGFYTLYFTAASGNGLGMIVLQGGIVSGADATGVLLDGTYTWNSKKQILESSIKVKIPANIPLLQGGITGPEGLTYDVNFQVSLENEDIPYFRVETPAGAVNVKMVKIRNLE